ncbi:MAG: helix-turn-helix transcriptional regulator, partial [Candidatus Eremiobacteraeota bacterium]|nr:helix-turn-helix transcriptional regulator [Candidatus Eremiobacteraeota bacterium]
TEAAERFHAIGWPLHEARSLEAAERLKQALEIFKSVEATYHVRRLEAILNPVNRLGRSKTEMTARELEVRNLLLEGKSNKAIAEKLVLSERTVEHHVASVLAKAGVSSRSELIAKVGGVSPSVSSAE